MQTICLFAFLLTAAFYGSLGGLRAGLSVGGAGFALTLVLHFTRGDGLDGYTLTMFGVSLILFAILLELATREHRQQQQQVSLRHMWEVTHELKTPLTSVSGYAETLLYRWDRLTEEQKVSAIESIAQNARQLRMLIDQLADLSWASSNGHGARADRSQRRSAEHDRPE